VLVGLLLSGAGVLIWRSLGDRSLERVQRRGSIRIGYAIEAPFAFLNERGEVTGEAPEIARRVAAALGIAQVDWQVSEFGTLLSDLRAGRVDVVAAGVFITPERARLVAFADPTFHVTQALLVRRGNPLGLHSYEDAIRNPAVRLAVLDGSVEARLLSSLGMREPRLVAVPEARAGQKALQLGMVDGVALSSPTVRWMAQVDRQRLTEVAEPFGQPGQALVADAGYGAVAFRKEDVRLRQGWNRAQRAFLGTPEHHELVARFGFTHAESPGGITANQVLGAP